MAVSVIAVSNRKFKCSVMIKPKWVFVALCTCIFNFAAKAKLLELVAVN